LTLSAKKPCLPRDRSVRQRRAAPVILALHVGAQIGRANRDGRPWMPDHVSKKFKRLAVQAGVPAIKLHEGGRHTGNSLMYDAEVRQDIVMRQVGHASKEISQRYNHPMIEAHLAAAGQVSALVRRAGGRT
jgi:integrase